MITVQNPKHRWERTTDDNDWVDDPVKREIQSQSSIEENFCKFTEKKSNCLFFEEKKKDGEKDRE